MEEQNMVPFAVLETISARHDRTMKRMCIAFVVAFCVLAVTNCVMFCFWCNRVSDVVGDAKDEIISTVVNEVVDDGKV